jgi:GMP synthase (glutamine-hydrolysing)
MSRRVLCVLHQAHSTTGQVGIALKQLGHQVQVVRPLVGQRLPRKIERFDGLVVFGGPMSANEDKLPGIRTELQLIERWMHMDRPVWGICLGAQLMARVLGSRVFSHQRDQVEIGWYPINPVGQGKQIFGPLTCVYQWHREGYHLPYGSIRLASGVNEGYFEEQAFRVGHNALATQFHPEMHPRMMNRWLARAGHMLELPGAMNINNHRGGLIHYYPKQSKWLKQTLNQLLESNLYR